MSIYVELQERKRELQRLNDELNAEESTVVHSLYQKIEKQQSAIDDDDVEDVIRKAQAPLLAHIQRLEEEVAVSRERSILSNNDSVLISREEFRRLKNLAAAAELASSSSLPLPLSVLSPSLLSSRNDSNKAVVVSPPRKRSGNYPFREDMIHRLKVAELSSLKNQVEVYKKSENQAKFGIDLAIRNLRAAWIRTIICVEDDNNSNSNYNNDGNSSNNNNNKCRNNSNDDNVEYDDDNNFDVAIRNMVEIPTTRKVGELELKLQNLEAGITSTINILENAWCIGKIIDTA